MVVEAPPLIIGVLALQGAFREHRRALTSLGAVVREVRLPEQLTGLDGLIIPGGESTAMGKLMETYGLITPLRQSIAHGLPTWGTCAGLIVLARDIEAGAAEGQSVLGLMDISVDRNAFGRQLDSFETQLPIPVLGDPPFPAIFIRAPAIRSVGDNVAILAELDHNTIVAAVQGTMMVTAFHPELSSDTRLHEYFLARCREAAQRTPER